MGSGWSGFGGTKGVPRDMERVSATGGEVVRKGLEFSKFYNWMCCIQTFLI